MIPLRATVRLQLHAGFDFAAAQAQLPYFSRLGISHLYLSPIAEARPGSTHGYDGIDPTRISAALGGEAAFVALATAAREHRMGILLDIVPNHLAADVANPWWRDVLMHGRQSRFASWFDIDWDAPGCGGKLWLPVLAQPLAEVLQQRQLQLCPGEGAAPLLCLGGQTWPLDPRSLPTDAGAWPDWMDTCNHDPLQLDEVVQRQAYRLAWWRTGPDRVNYRRFFDINDLAAVRVEQEDAFAAMHALPVRLVAQGWVDGLRVDHVDGLADPAAYLQRLRGQLDEAAASRGLPAGSVPLYVEKILAEGEALPDWACDGTTGYDFMDEVGALLHDPDGEPALTDLWVETAATGDDFSRMQQDARAQMLDGSLHADLQRCLRSVLARAGQGRGQDGAAAEDPACGDLTEGMFERATRALLQCFPVYRTHGMHSDADRQVLRCAGDAAAARLHGGERAALNCLMGWLADTGSADNAALRLRMEQLSAPLNAKAVEDTAFYRYGRLLSRNEVGSEPSRLSLPASAFVALAQARGQRFPRALLAVATHDHKRGPDARLRLAVLSAWPQLWRDALQAWQALCVQQQQVLPLPPAEACMTWQTLLSAWPLQEAVDAGVAERLAEWLRKALREGKRLSSWSDPDEALEQGAVAWLHWLCTAQAAQPLRSHIHAFASRCAAEAARLGLAQTALQYVCPGVPDLYQGNEGWDTSLVDPDNRREVDYRQRELWLQDTRSWHNLLQHWQDGAPKARLLATLLQLRQAHPALFAQGDFTALDCADAQVLVLLRRHGQQRLLLAVGLRPRSDSSTDAGLVGAPSRDERLLPAGAVPAGRYRSLLDRRLWNHAGGAVAAAALFNDSPVALWFTDKEDDDGR